MGRLPGACQWYAKGGLFHLMRFADSQLVGCLPARQLAQHSETSEAGAAAADGEEQWVELGVQGQATGSQGQGRGQGARAGDARRGAEYEVCGQWMRFQWGVARAWLLLGDERAALAHLRSCRKWAKKGTELAPKGAQGGTREG